MKAKVFIGSTMAVALMGLGVLAGSVAGSSSASAQTAVTPQPTTQAAPVNPSAGPPDGMMRGMKGHGPRDFGGKGGQADTAAGATQSITGASDLIALVKTDLAYANGKMDTADVQRWLNGADALLKSAQDANTKSQYGQANAYANAARELAMTADSQMAQKLGADKLPSYSQRPQRPEKQMPTGTTLTQAQASRMLAQTYNELTMTAAQAKNATNATEAAPYLTDAQNAYKAAYNAYQAKNYTDAVASARLAEQLNHVAEAVVRASTAPANSDTPVTVPAPNF